jgi:hypothetical protein
MSQETAVGLRIGRQLGGLADVGVPVVEKAATARVSVVSRSMPSRPGRRGP